MKNQFKEVIKKTLNDYDDNVFFYWKARVAFYALLKAINIKPGDEVILPAYTCVVVPNAIIYLGATPIYIDVSTDNYNMDTSQIEKVITNRTKAIICQNTYGLSTDLEVLQRLAKKHALYTIEDCTHGFGGQYNGIANGLYCDAAIYSTQWNKPFSTGVGGFSITKNKIIAKKLAEFENQLIPPSRKELWNLKILYFVKRYLVNDVTYWPLVHFYRWLSHNTPVVGSSSIEEINSTTIPADYFKGFSETQAKEGLHNLNNLQSNLEIRKRNAYIYTNFLSDYKRNHVKKKWFKNHSFLKYPLLVKDRDEFMALAEKSNIELGEWFLSPLHPVKGDLSAWKLEIENYPNAKYLSSHVVNLPTTPKNINNVLLFLKKNSDLII